MLNNKSKGGLNMTTIYINTDDELKDAINKYKNNKDVKTYAQNIIIRI